MLYLHGVGHFHPENVIDNQFLEGLEIGTNDAWILERVGIRSRRTVLSLDYIRQTKNKDPRAAREASLFTNAQTGTNAARMALARAGITTADIGLVIGGGCSPQWSSPAEGCVIAAELGIEAQAFDVNSACSTFAAQLDLVGRMAPESLPPYVLLVIPENNTRCVDYSDRSAAVLWGDASAAAVVSTRVPARARLVWSGLTSSPSGWNKVAIPAGGHFFQDGAAVQGFAIRKTGWVLKQMREQAQPVEERMWFVGHQANLMMLESVCRREGLPMERHLFNVDEYGNCGAAGAPSVISQRWESFKDGDEIAVVVVGSGLSWGGALVRFGTAA